jgi:hypothetical protein
VIIKTILSATACGFQGPPVDLYHIQDMEGGLSYYVVQDSQEEPPEPMTPHGMEAVPTAEPWQTLLMRRVLGKEKEAA